MMLQVLTAIVFAASLCADCFAVSICSSVTLRRVDLRSVSITALIFSIIHIGLLLSGYAFGDLFVDVIGVAAKWVGMLLLGYVGCSMLRGAFDREYEVRNLSSLRNIIIGAVATSIDAFVVGVSLSMDKETWAVMLVNAIVLFVMTIVCVAAGILFGQRIGARFGKVAEGVGGAVLIVLAIGMLF